MKRNLMNISIRMIVIFGMLMISTPSIAQSAKPATQPLIAPPVPLWKQVNTDGFGNPANAGIQALEIFNSRLYATSSNYVIGGRVWRLETNGDWTAVNEPGFGSVDSFTNRSIPDLTVFDGKLYAGTGWAGLPGQIWRTTNGTSWDKVVAGGFGNPNNFLVAPFGIYDGMIYAGTENTTNGLEIWRSSTGNPGEWAKVVTAGNGSPNNYVVTSFIEFDGHLYAAVENITDGAEIWQTDYGSNWSPVASGGFGDPDNTQTGGMTTFGGYLYVGTRNDVTGAQIFRSANGTAWSPVLADGFGDVNNYKIEMLYKAGDMLFAGTDNEQTGTEIWQSTNGLAWNKINIDGFGDSNNEFLLWNSSTIEFEQHLIVGTENHSSGGEIWQLYYGYQNYLPFIRR